MNTNLTRHNYDLFDNDILFTNFLNSFAKDENRIMKTDIKETDKEYVLSVELPGISKENIKISFENEYLTISASNSKVEENTKYLHKERYVGNYERSYYVGDINENDITASFENGILEVNIPKETIKKEEKKFIAIN